MATNIGLDPCEWPERPSTPWDGEVMFNAYIYEYLAKRGYVATAHALLKEARLPKGYKPPILTPQGLLYEWWCTFWVFFEGNREGSDYDDLNTYLDYYKQKTKKAKEAQQRAFRKLAKPYATRLRKPLPKRKPPPAASEIPATSPYEPESRSSAAQHACSSEVPISVCPQMEQPLVVQPVHHYQYSGQHWVDPASYAEAAAPVQHEHTTWEAGVLSGHQPMYQTEDQAFAFLGAPHEISSGQTEQLNYTPQNSPSSIESSISPTTPTFLQHFSNGYTEQMPWDMKAAYSPPVADAGNIYHPQADFDWQLGGFLPSTDNTTVFTTMFDQVTGTSSVY